MLPFLFQNEHKSLAVEKQPWKPLGIQQGGLGWRPMSEFSADKDVPPSSWPNTSGPSPSLLLSYQFCSVPASLRHRQHPQRRPLCFFIYLTTRLKSFISLLGNSSSQFFFLFFSFVKPSPPCFELLSVRQLPLVCRCSLFDAAVLPPISVASNAVINFPHPPGICFPSTLPCDTLVFHAAVSAVEPSIDILS